MFYTDITMPSLNVKDTTSLKIHIVLTIQIEFRAVCISIHTAQNTFVIAFRMLFLKLYYLRYWLMTWSGIWSLTSPKCWSIILQWRWKGPFLATEHARWDKPSHLIDDSVLPFWSWYNIESNEWKCKFMNISYKHFSNEQRIICADDFEGKINQQKDSK